MTPQDGSSLQPAVLVPGIEVDLAQGLPFPMMPCPGHEQLSSKFRASGSWQLACNPSHMAPGAVQLIVNGAGAEQQQLGLSIQRNISHGSRSRYC